MAKSTKQWLCTTNSGIDTTNTNCISSFTWGKVCKFVLKSPSKSCEADPIPTDLWKCILPAFSPIFTTVVNSSITFIVFPDNLKETWVEPLVKKANLDLIRKNYRPVSNLEFQGKLIEWVVTSQLTDYIEKNKLIEHPQSAYCTIHSMDTALWKVKSDIINTMDNQQVICLVLLDLSAACDTVEHSILLARLETFFGITGTALHWIKSYLTSRTQCVVIDDTNRNRSRSIPVTLTLSKPQGSVLGPFLFTLYTTPLGNICQHHNITFHLHADDQHLYLAFRPGTTGSQPACITQLEECIGEIRSWMAFNLLKFHDEKLNS